MVAKLDNLIDFKFKSITKGDIDLKKSSTKKDEEKKVIKIRKTNSLFKKLLWRKRSKMLEYQKD